MMMVKMSCKFNFSAGPAILPKKVLLKAQSELLNWQDSGMSVMEMSHRGKEYAPIIENTELNLRKLLNLPNNYKVLFLQGGAVTQNFMVPMNLLNSKTASYVISGYWSKRTFNDAQPFSGINLAASSESINYTKAPIVKTWDYKKDDSYIHFCLNETIHGVEYFDDPNIKNIPIRTSNLMQVNVFFLCLVLPIEILKYFLSQMFLILNVIISYLCHLVLGHTIVLGPGYLGV